MTTEFGEQSQESPQPDGVTYLVTSDDYPLETTDGDFRPARNVAFEDMTLAEAVAQFIFSPAETWRMFMRVAKAPGKEVRSPTRPYRTEMQSFEPVTPSPFQVFAAPAADQLLDTPDAGQREALVLGLRLCALIIAIIGTAIMATRRFEGNGLAEGAPYVLVGFALWLATEAHRRLVRGVSAATLVDTAPQAAVSAVSDFSLTVSWQRAALALIGTGCSLGAWNYTGENVFRTEAFYLWIASIVLWVAALAPDMEQVRAGVDSFRAALRRFRIRGNWTLLALVLIVLLGAVFRLSNLRGVPPEMTSDHVEKLLDAQRVLDGTHQIFFPNNGGREPFQMYTMALFSQLPGLSMNFPTLKLLSALEGLITLPVLWWMGREVIGKDEPLLGNLVGLTLAALVAASYWHTSLSRLALRIVLTPLVTALLLVYLSRALRDNRRSDFIRAGLVLGIGLYTYQAVRMLPVVVLIGVGLALLFKARSRRTLAAYLYNLAVLVVIAGVVFVPLLHFSTQYPEDFWRRTSGRVLGDDTIQTTDESGNLVERTATLDERLAAFQENVPILLENIRNALLMFNWKGDVAWINGAPNRPAMDPLTGALLLLGLAAWIARMARRRDPVDWLMPGMLFVMLLPSALSIAYPIENPSATRTSGALPEAYLFAALPLALVMRSAIRLVSGWRGAAIAAGVAAAITLLAFNANASLYFGTDTESYLGSYLTSSLPYSEIGNALRGFADSGGSFANAFMIAYPYWWDHRAMGIEAGLLDWPNGIVSRDQILSFMYESSQRVDKYRLDPDKDLLFFVSPDDLETQALLLQLFPNGYQQTIVSYQPENTYVMFRVPPLGQEAFSRLMEMQLTGAG
jgi:hypothetical protein